MSRLLIAGAALMLAAALAAAMPAAAINNPIPGVDIIVRKDPDGSALVVGSVGRGGAFGGSAKLEAGTYVIYTACSGGVRCPPHTLTSLMVDGRTVPLTPSSGGTRDFVNKGLITNSNSKLVVVRGTVRIDR